MNESKLSDAALAELLTLTVEVDSLGNIVYRNHLGQVHRVHGPAIIWATGSKGWYQNDQMHRTDGPALEWTDGDTSWFLYGNMVSEDEFNERIKSI